MKIDAEKGGKPNIEPAGAAQPATSSAEIRPSNQGNLRPSSTLPSNRADLLRLKQPVPMYGVRKGKGLNSLNEVVIEDLKTVIRARRKYQSTRRRDAVFGFLQDVYEIGLRAKRQGRVVEYCRSALSFLEHHPPMYGEVFRVLLFCAGQTESKARSRFSRVLQVAEAHRAKSIKAFAKQHGGLNQVAAKYKHLDV